MVGAGRVQDQQAPARAEGTSPASQQGLCSVAAQRQHRGGTGPAPASKIVSIAVEFICGGCSADTSTDTAPAAGDAGAAGAATAAAAGHAAEHAPQSRSRRGERTGANVWRGARRHATLPAAPPLPLLQPRNRNKSLAAGHASERRAPSPPTIHRLLERRLVVGGEQLAKASHGVQARLAAHRVGALGGTRRCRRWCKGETRSMGAWQAAAGLKTCRTTCMPCALARLDGIHGCLHLCRHVFGRDGRGRIRRRTLARRLACWGREWSVRHAAACECSGSGSRAWRGPTARCGACSHARLSWRATGPG